MRSVGHLMLAAMAMSVLSAAAHCLVAAAIPTETGKLAADILAQADVKGGLIVHLGCGDGRLTAALRANESYIVHGLDADPVNVEKARAHIRSLGVYGPVSVAQWTDPMRLPYADNLISLLVAEDLGKVPMDEVMRVLAPLGAVCTKGRDGGWTKTAKPWPQGMDEWTHWFHGPDGGNVSRDQLVGPPRRLQWTCEPYWARHHALPNTVSVAVSSGGRLFYFLDESPVSILAGVPDRWSLVARDAFSGVELWRRPVSTWGRAAWGHDFYTDPDKQLRHFWTVPADAQRRMVADGDRLFVPLGYREPISVLDGATGKSLHTFAGTQGCRIVLRAGTLLYLAGGQGKDESPVRAYDARTFEPAWNAATSLVDRPVDMAVRDGRLAVLGTASLAALDAATGKPLWLGQWPAGARMGRFVRLVLTGPAVLVIDDADSLLAFSPKDGTFLWSYPAKRRIHDEQRPGPVELFPIGNLAWASSGPKTFAGLNLMTGAVERTIDATAVLTSSHHHRCYTDRATERFFIFGKENVEFVGVGEPVMQVHNWVRGTCRFGVLPANGMLYVPPSACTCYMNIMLRGFNALAAGRDALAPEAEPPLERGPAYGSGGQDSTSAASDWPTFRHDGSRSGVSPEAVPTAVAKAWQADIGGRLTAPVVAQGRLLAADIDRHTVHCLDASTGTPTWTYVPGGRIDSPPTLDAGRALFGCRDGWVYCLRLADGALVWRLRAAPGERQIVANGQLESPWPLHGSVLVHHGVAYVAAGRATRLDGGIRVLAIDPATGRVIRKVTLDTPQRTAPLKDNFDPDERTGFLTDIMVADGEDVWMRTAKFTPQLQAEFTGFRGGTGGGGMSPTGGVTALAHLTAVSGFLDDRYFDRVYWGYEGVFGQMLVVDRQMVYGVRAYDHTGFSLSYRPGSGYVLFGETHEGKKPRNPPPVKLKDEPSEKGTKDNEAPDVRQEIFRPHPLPSNLWTRQCDIRVLAMALADKTLILVGPPDSVDPKDPYAAFEGRGPAKLRLASAADGNTLAEMDLESSPVWNGLAVAGGRVFLTTTDGKVLCLAGRQAAPASTRP